MPRAAASGTVRRHNEQDELTRKLPEVNDTPRRDDGARLDVEGKPGGGVGRGSLSRCTLVPAPCRGCPLRSSRSHDVDLLGRRLCRRQPRRWHLCRLGAFGGDGELVALCRGGYQGRARNPCDARTAGGVRTPMRVTHSTQVAASKAHRWPYRRNFGYCAFRDGWRVDHCRCSPAMPRSCRTARELERMHAHCCLCDCCVDSTEESRTSRGLALRL